MYTLAQQPVVWSVRSVNPLGKSPSSTLVRQLAIWLFLGFLAARLGAQEYRFQFYGGEQGLTNLAVKTLYQDHKDFLWVSTENGIFRYDGERFQSFGSEEDLPPFLRRDVWSLRVIAPPMCGRRCPGTVMVAREGGRG